MLKFLESIVLFVPDTAAAAQWYAELFGVPVRFENPRYAFIRAGNVLIGFHPADAQCPGGIGGTTAYWEVDDFDATLASLQQRGCRVHRGPGQTDFGAKAAMLIDPFGCTIGLNGSSPASREATAG